MNQEFLNKIFASVKRGRYTPKTQNEASVHACFNNYNVVSVLACYQNYLNSII